jgi:hypothetical protein
MMSTFPTLEVAVVEPTSEVTTRLVKRSAAVASFVRT